MPRIGMAGSSIMLSPVEDAVNMAVAGGFEAFEVFGAFPQAELDDLGSGAIKRIRETAEMGGVELCVHAPFSTLNIASYNRGIRQESVRQNLRAIDVCAELGGTVVVVHTGEYVRYEGITRKGDPGMQLQWQLNLESLSLIAEHARQKGVIMCLENVGFEKHQVDQSLADLIEIRDAIGSPALKFTMDIGHARLSEGVEKTIEVLSPDIRHIHFTDNMGEHDDHLVIGEGNFDYTGFIEFIKSFPYIVTLEVVKVGTDPGPALRSKEYFKKLMGRT